MQELNYCHPLFSREQYVHVLTERNNHFLHMGCAAGGAGTESKAKICFFSLLTPPLGGHRKGAWVPHGCAHPPKSSVASAKLVISCPAGHRVHTNFSRGSWKPVQPSCGLRGIEGPGQVPAWAGEGGVVLAPALGDFWDIFCTLWNCNLKVPDLLQFKKIGIICHLIISNLPSPLIGLEFSKFHYYYFYTIITNLRLTVLDSFIHMKKVTCSQYWVYYCLFIALC